MTTSDLGNIGEFVGSILILVSIVVLIFQVRQAEKTIRASNYLESARLVYESYDAGLAGEFLPAAIAKDQDGEELTKAEEQALIMNWRSLIRRSEVLHHQQNEGLISDARLRQFGERLGATQRRISTFRMAWEMDRPSMLPEFRVWAESFFETVADAT